MAGKNLFVTQIGCFDVLYQDDIILMDIINLVQKARRIWPVWKRNGHGKTTLTQRTKDLSLGNHIYKPEFKRMTDMQIATCTDHRIFYTIAATSLSHPFTNLSRE